jgi:hypothetical protein
MKSNPITAKAAAKVYANSVAKKVNETLIKGSRDLGNSQDIAATWNSSQQGETRQVTTPGSSSTNYVGGGSFKNKEEKDWYDGEIKKRIDAGMSQEEAIQDYRNTYKIGEKTTTTTPDTVETVKDPDQTFTGNLYAAQSGTATSSYGGRSDRRNVKATTKDQYKNKIRGLRSKIGSDILDEEGNPTGQKYTREQFKQDKKAARTQMFENRQTAFDNQQENLQRQIEQGRVKKESYRRPDRVKTRGDYGDAAQMEMGIAQQKADQLNSQSNYQNVFKEIGDKLSTEPIQSLNFKPSYSYKPPLTSDQKVNNFNKLMYPDNVNYGQLGSGIQKRGYKMGGYGSKNKK